MSHSSGFQASPTPQGLYCKAVEVIGLGHNNTDRTCDAAPITGERRADRQVNDDAPNRRLDPCTQLQPAQLSTARREGPFLAG